MPGAVLGPGPVEGMQVDVRQERGDNPALRCPRDRLGDHPVSKHTCLQPQPDQLEHPPVRHALRDQRKQPRMVDLPEEVPDVGLEDELLPARKRHPDHFQSIGGRQPRAVPEATRQEVGLEDWFEDELRCLLTHPVAHGRDAQRPLPAVRLGDLHPTHQRRAVDARTEVTGKLAEHPLDPVALHRLQGHTIDPGGATIRSHPPPRLHQDVIPVDPVIQGVETPTLGLLGRSP